MSGIKKGKRSCSSCLHYGNSRHEEGMANCRLTTYRKCEPDICPWYLNRKMQEESFEKARQNYIKRHGSDDYYALGYAKTSWIGERSRDWDKEDEAKNAESH